MNAGTVEFLVDAEENFYFLEMNTRLQVEHPVTEMVTGLDLVHLQLRVAMGEPLPIRQEDVRLRGHAIECRIYAEDPENNFFPSPGLITRLVQPGGPGIREDCAVFAGWTVPLDYDPMLSKLVAFAETREMAIDRMLRALEEYVIGGIKTNIWLFRRILTDEDFRAARIDTGYLERLLAAGPAAVAGERCRRMLWRWRRRCLLLCAAGDGGGGVMLRRRAGGPRRGGGRGCGCDGLARDWREEAAGGVAGGCSWGVVRADGVLGGWACGERWMCGCCSRG